MARPSSASRASHFRHMPSDNTPMDEALKLSAELAAIARQQYEALLRSPFALMSAEESGRYDQRRLRIAEICDSLSKFGRR